MSFDIPSNHGRTQKIVEILGHVERSANANKASEDEIAAILAPAVAALRALGAIPSAITLPPPSVPLSAAHAPPERPTSINLADPSINPPDGAWAAPKGGPVTANIRDLAASASLKDLTIAMAVYINRVEDELPST